MNYYGQQQAGGGSVFPKFLHGASLRSRPQHSSDS